MSALDTQVLVTALFSSIFGSGFMSFVIFMIQRRDKKREAMQRSKSAETRMLIGLGHDKLVYLTDKYVKRGAITLKEKRNLKFLAEPYFEAGGNGDAKIGCDACKGLDVVSEDTAEEMDMYIKRKEYGINDAD